MLASETIMPRVQTGHLWLGQPYILPCLSWGQVACYLGSFLQGCNLWEVPFHVPRCSECLGGNDGRPVEVLAWISSSNLACNLLSAAWLKRWILATAFWSFLACPALLDGHAMKALLIQCGCADGGLINWGCHVESLVED